MAESSSKCSIVAAFILYIINFISMVVCVFLFAFGLWIISSPSTLSAAVDSIENSTIKALSQDMLTLRVGIAVSAVAAFLFFLSFMGFYGALTKSPFLLFMYAIITLLLLLLECALLFYFSSNLIEKDLQDDGPWTHAMRLIFECCEHNTTIPQERTHPWSCCGPELFPNNCTTTLTYKKDCRSSIQDWLSRYQVALYCSIGILYIVLATCAIIRRSSSKYRLNS